jgi:HEPN domain-containing protein
MYGLNLDQSIYVHARGFHQASEYLATTLGKPNPMAGAAVVINSAFASELYIKCLILLEKGQLIKDQHDLGKLFRQLHADTQTMIETPFDAEMARGPEISDATKAMLGARRPPRTLREALAEGADAFVRWRYLYETDDSRHRFFALFPLPKILNAVILGRKPGWSNFAISLARLPDAPPTSHVPRTP